MLRWWRLVAALVLTMGIAAQIWVFAHDRGLWHDELYVAYNLQHKAFLRLAGGLYWNQTAPAAWIGMEKSIFHLFGGNEYLLRLPQLIGGVATLALTLVIGVKAIGRWAALLAVTLVAISPMMLYYAAEMKPYALEACGALVIMLCAAFLGERLVNATATKRDLLIFAVLTTVVMLGGFSNLISLGGSLAAIVLTLAYARRWRACLTAVFAALPALLLGAAQIIVLKVFGTFLPGIEGDFADGMPGSGASLAETISWLPRLWPAFVKDPLHWGYPVTVLLIALAGLARLWLLGQRLWSAIFAGVLGTAVLAAAVNGLPMVDRVSLYLVAPMMLLIASGIDGCVRAVAWAFQRFELPRIAVAVPAAVLAAATVFAAVPFAREGFGQLAHPRTVALYQAAELHPDLDNGRAMMREIQQRWQPDDVLLSYIYTQPMVSWYGERFGLPINGYIDVASTCDPGSLSQVLSGAKRVWYVHLEPLTTHPPDFQAQVVAELAKHGSIVASHTYGSTDVAGPLPAWVLFDLTLGPDPSPPQPVPARTCLKVAQP